MTSKEAIQFKQMHHALKRIAAYDSSDRLRRSSQKDWGVDFEEAIEMAYENVQQEAKNGLRGIRIPKTSP